MFEKCRSIVSKYHSIKYICPKSIGAERRGLYDTIKDISRLCVNKINFHSEGLKPFIRQCSRQVDYVAAQKFKRGQQWIRFYTQLWSRDRLSALLIQMGRRLGIVIRHRRISTLVLSGAAFVPAKSQRERDSVDDEIDTVKSDKINQERRSKR